MRRLTPECGGGGCHLPPNSTKLGSAPAATHKTSTIPSSSSSFSFPTSLMPTLIKGIISPVTDPLLTLTAAGANDQPGECSHALCAIVSSPLLTVVASQSFPADASLRPRSTPINANQFHQFLLSHVSSSSVTCFHKRSREEPHSVHGRGSGTQLTGVPGLVDTGTGPPRPGEQPEGACLLSSCFVLPHLLYASCPVYCCCPHRGNYGTDPSGPSAALWDPVVIGARGLWSLLG